MTISFNDRVAIVTGGGNGLGREHCLAYARLGAKVVVNDLGGAPDGTGSSTSAAQSVVDEIRAAGGEAIANGANIAKRDEVDAMVEAAMAEWGRVDILVNNAGILRDKSFAKMELDDFQAVVDVHLMGTANCCKAVWPIMREQNYGRIVMTSSSSGIFGNFGQANYSAAKMAVVGLMNTLHLEGTKLDIRVNTIAPFAGTRLLEGLMPDDLLALAAPGQVTPAVLFLTSHDAPSRTMMGAGAGAFSVVHIYETNGKFLGTEGVSADDIATNWEEISSAQNERESQNAGEQSQHFLALMQKALG
ncbi:MAG: SDR family NAD(P)-dependent oxidoreductase [Pseudomonadota bacterium]